ncbi:hypothetical protein P3W66_19280, partial [Achromobacter denitrificans]|uniref:hypothetical protein n=1 Tax=Achromobacter denitrificans TaxID=32002 RepID=UPI0023E80A39
PANSLSRQHGLRALEGGIFPQHGLRALEGSIFVQRISRSTHPTFHTMALSWNSQKKPSAA